MSIGIGMSKRGRSDNGAVGCWNQQQPLARESTPDPYEVLGSWFYAGVFPWSHSGCSKQLSWLCLQTSSGTGDI